MAMVQDEERTAVATESDRIVGTKAREAQRRFKPAPRTRPIHSTSQHIRDVPRNFVDNVAGTTVTSSLTHPPTRCGPYPRFQRANCANSGSALTAASWISTRACQCAGDGRRILPYTVESGIARVSAARLMVLILPPIQKNARHP